jgi:hypothetical protein
MKQLLKDIFYSFPIQLFILHFRKYQVLLVFWYLLASTINSGFMKTFGADALFFAPEYLGTVNALGAGIVGLALGVFFMSWNITTFILHSRRTKFLATTTQPFLKYCINNSLLPIIFLVFYFVKLFPFNREKELMTVAETWLVIAGIMGGTVLLLAFSFAYFFGAEKRIRRNIVPVLAELTGYADKEDTPKEKQQRKYGMTVSYYLSGTMKLRKVRDVSHYNQDFMDLVFKRHHLSGIFSIALAFISLIVIGFFMDDTLFQVPAAASVLIFFAVMTAVIGALSYFLESWSLPFVIVLLILINLLYEDEIIDPRNKAYGLDYTNIKERPKYDKGSLQRLCLPGKIKADKDSMLLVLENWMKKQTVEKPVMIFINVSGGGLRSGTFVMNTLQQLDSISQGKLMQHTMLISGASGGMLSAAYYRELYHLKQQGKPVNLHDRKYTDNIAQDLLNPLFSSMIARDIFSPAQKFSVGNRQYVKDRGYAFEQKLDANTEGVLHRQLKDYSSAERSASIPLIIFNSTINRDGRRMMISTQPISFMMKPALYADNTAVSPDAVDFAALFAKQDPLNIRLLTTLRMNATFPYILPNVWLPSNPVIDVMDAGLRDNFGQETSLRFIDHFSGWIKANTGGVLILQIRDRMNDNWQQPFETGSLSDILIKPATMLQHNWYKIQDYNETDQFNYLADRFNGHLYRIPFLYVPEAEEKGAALNFHLTASEKRDVQASFYNKLNQQSVKEVLEMLK